MIESIETMVAKYIEDRSKLDIPNFKRENFCHFVRYTPLKPDSGGFICFTRIEENEIDNQIEEQIDYFQQYCNELEWKVYDFDHPKNLKKRLMDHGFEEGAEEVLIVYDISQHQPKSVMISNESPNFEKKRFVSLSTTYPLTIKLHNTIRI